MKNIETILSDFGITIPEGKAADLRKAVAENYKTVAEFAKLQERHDALDTSLKDVQGKLAAFDGVDVAALKGQITTLTNDLQTERDNRKKDAAAVKLRSTVDTFLSGKHFVNDITRESITDKLVTALGSDDARGKSIDDLFTGLVTDRDGKEIPGILVADPASKARFSSDHSGMVPPAGGAKEYVAQKYKNNPFSGAKTTKGNDDLCLSSTVPFTWMSSTRQLFFPTCFIRPGLCPA